jgi:glycosyltransferase involved in cell wall biosynthesis
LCALEAMACGIPAIVANRAPFTEHFSAEDCLFTNPDDPTAIAAAMRQALSPHIATRLRRRGPMIAARFGWDRVAASHAPLYTAFADREVSHA